MIEINLRRPFVHWTDHSLSVQAVGWIALAISILAGATYNAFAKHLTVALSPFSLLFLSELITACIVLFSFGALPTLRRLAELPRETYPPLLIVALLNSALAPFLWFTGLVSTSAVNASLFGNSDVLFLILMAVFVLHEPWTKAHVCAAFCIAIGILVVTLRGLQSGITLQSGDMLILLATMMFAAGSIVFRKYLHNSELQLVILVRSLVAIGIFFLLSPFLPHTFMEEIRAFPLELVPVLLGFAFIARFLNLFSYYASIERLPVTTVSLVSTLSIIAGPAFAYFYLGPTVESLHWYHFVGGGLILLGTILLELLGVHPSEKHLANHLEQRVHHRP